MTIVHPPSVEQNPDTIEALDWAPPCEYSAHRRVGTGAAIWVVIRTSSPCCGKGPAPHAIQYYCGPCWTYRNHRGLCTCMHCGAWVPALDDVLRVERI